MDPIIKSARIEKSAVTEADLEKINRFTLKTLEASEVFCFNVVLCGNAIDRAFERFTDKSLEDMAALYVGRTVIKDHAHRLDGQIARIYDTWIEDGEDGYKQLRASCYMVRTASNADLIRDIEGGIKQEGSVSFSPEHYVCGICQKDNMQGWCAHWPGVTYRVAGEDKLCTFEIDGVTDVYEFSLVAVPAQPEAGVCKAYKESVKGKAPEEPETEPQTDAEEKKLRERLIKARIRAFQNKNKKGEPIE